MKALSLTPWWAAIVAAGLKPIENRKWPTSFRGDFLIHASLGNPKKDPYEVEDFLRGARLTWEVRQHARTQALGRQVYRGGIVARATIVDCVTESDSPWFFGPYGFVLENVRAVPFVACKGALGFWNVPADVLAKLSEAA